MLRDLWQGLNLLDVVLVPITLDRDSNQQLTKLQDLQGITVFGNHVEVGWVELGQ